MKQEELVLETLRKNPIGVSNTEFISMNILRASSVIEVLRSKGYDIKSFKSKETGSNIWWYKLVGEGKEVDNRTAYDKFAHILYKNGFKEVAEKLPELLEESEVILRKKPRKFD